MDPNQSELPSVIPPEVEMAEISEKMQNLNPSQDSEESELAPAPEEAEGAVGGEPLTDSSDPVHKLIAQAEATRRNHNGPIVMIIVGMAASGKTTLTQRLTAELIQRKSPPYIVNLDPACNDPPYPVNIDIRDVVKYKKVMEVYNLGPNGAIVTSLNLFATKFNEVLSILQQKRKTHQYIIIDTPGQIEVFMWSASGNIITESLAALFPTVMIYVTDLVSNVNPITFISNMTYACSILYKTKLPLVVTLNKCDLVDPRYAKDWMTDFTIFEDALRERQDYAANLASSLALGLEEFYNQIDHTVVSAYDGFGMDQFFASVQKAVSDYETVYRPMYEHLLEEKKKSTEKKQKAQLKNLKKDLSSGEESCFIRAGRDAGAGLSLRLDDDDDDDLSSEEEAGAPEENEEQNFNDLFTQVAGKRKEQVDKIVTEAAAGAGGDPSSKQKQ